MSSSRVLIIVPASACAAVAFASIVSTASAAGPALSVKAGSSTACGGPEAMCVPGADVFDVPNVAAPVVVDTIAKLGLQAGDDITSLSCRASVAAGSRLYVSVSSASVGAAGTAPDLASEASGDGVGADIYSVGTFDAPALNSLLVDDDGSIADPAGAFAGLGLDEADDVDALAGCDLSDADTENIYFTLGAGSPTLALVPTSSPAAVLVKSIGSPGLPNLAFQAGVLGLTNADSLDALAYDVSLHKVVYSLAPGSPSLGSIPAAAGDLLTGFGTPMVLASAATLGLDPGDDIDAVDAIVDPDGDLLASSRDNCPSAANNGQQDTDDDGTGDACDDRDLDGHLDLDDNCPDVPNALQTDTDADDVGDACDACTNVGGVRDVVSAKLSLGKVNTDVVVGNDTLKVGARFVVTTTPFSMLDIENRSVRVVVTSADGDTIVDAALPYGPFTPGGAGWSSKGGKLWQFKDETGSPVSGITAAKIVDQSKKSPGLVQMNLSAKTGEFPVTAADLPLSLTLVAGDLNSSIDGDCGDAAFEASDCKLNGAGNKVGCKLP